MTVEALDDDDERRKAAYNKDVNNTARAMMYGAIMDAYQQWSEGLLTVQQMRAFLEQRWTACKTTSHIIQLNRQLIERWQHQITGFRVMQGASDADELVIIPVTERVHTLKKVPVMGIVHGLESSTADSQ